MRLRPAARVGLSVLAGFLIVTVAVGAYVLNPYSLIAGTNGIAPLSPVVTLPGGKRACERVPRVPSGASSVRIRAYTPDGPVAGVRVRLTDRRGPISAGSVSPADSGSITVPLSDQTRASNDATICLANQGKATLTIWGELKRRPRSSREQGEQVFAVTFLESQRSNWLTWIRTIERRFSYAQAGAVGSWALWLVGLLAVAASALALWSLVRVDPERRWRPRKTPGLLARLIGRIPAAGWLCALVALLNGIAWSLIVPVFQIPDEPAHVGYTQYLAETGRPPAGVAGVESLSSEERQVKAALGFKQMVHRPANRPLATSAAHRRLEHAAQRSGDRTSEGGSNVATSNPPLYYVLEAAGYRISPSTNLFDRIHLMRLLSALLASATVLLVFLFLRDLLPAVPWAWTVGSLTLALQPTLGFISGAVNPDNLLATAGAATFLALAVAFRRGLTPRRGLAIGACVALGVLAKLNMVGLLPGVALGVLILIRRAPHDRRKEALRGAAAAVAAAAVPVLLYMLVNVSVWDRGLYLDNPAEAITDPGLPQVVGTSAPTFSGRLSYVWQFYLPQLPGMAQAFDAYQAREVWLDGLVGRFGWLDYGFSDWVYELALLVGVLVAFFAGRELVARRQSLAARAGELTTYVAIVVGLLAAIHWAGSDWRFDRPGSGFEQARYLFPLLALYAGVIALAVRGAGKRFGPSFGVLLVSLAIAHSLVALLLTLTRYYG